MTHPFFAKGNDPTKPPWCGFIPYGTTRQCGLPESAQVHRALLVARCHNYREDLDRPCTGFLHFGAGDLQARCDTCFAWCGHMVADYIDGPEVERARMETHDELLTPVQTEED